MSASYADAPSSGLEGFETVALGDSFDEEVLLSESVTSFSSLSATYKMNKRNVYFCFRKTKRGACKASAIFS